MKNFIRVFVRLGLASALLFFTVNAFPTSKISWAADVFFKPNSIDVIDHHEKLKNLASRAAYVETEVIIATGHADSSEKDAQKLSELRALAVKKFLMTQGVSHRKIYVEGKGISWPNRPMGEYIAGRGFSNSSVDIELVGTRPLRDSSLFGLGHSLGRFMSRGNDPIDPLDNQLNTISPLVFGMQIKNQIDRENYFAILVLTALFEQRIDQVALYAPELKNCRQISISSNPDKFAVPNPYLYALAFLDNQYVTLLQHCEPRHEDTRQSIANLIYAKYCISKSNASSSDISAWANRLGWKGGKFNFQSLKSWEVYQCASNSPESILWLTDKGLSLEERSTPSSHVLEMAMDKNDFPAFSALLKAGANPNTRQVHTGGTALHWVNNHGSCTSLGCGRRSAQDKKRFWDLLIEHGADPQIANFKGELPVAP